jgi:hypothetical protein
MVAASATLVAAAAAMAVTMATVAANTPEVDDEQMQDALESAELHGSC